MQDVSKSLTSDSVSARCRCCCLAALPPAVFQREQASIDHFQLPAFESLTQANQYLEEGLQCSAELVPKRKHKTSALTRLKLDQSRSVT